MSSSMTFNQLTLLVKNLMAQEGVDVEYDIHIKGQSEKGANYIGEVTFVTVAPKGTTKKFNLVLKTISSSETHRKSLPVEKGFEREYHMYRVVFPAMKAFLEKSSKDVQLDYIAKFYSACNDYKSETLILEDLFVMGYEMWDRKKPLDMEHAVLSLKTLAKHHAISLAMSKKESKVFEDITRDMPDIFIVSSKKAEQESFFKLLIHRACEILKNANRNDLAVKVDVKLLQNIKSILYNQTSEEDKLVLCHGDCWNSNILFKYDDSTPPRPSEMCLIDFQFSLMDTPVKDLSFFFYTSADKHLLENFDLLLQTYHSTFSTTLEFLGCDSSDLFTYEDLLKHWEKYSAAGLIVSSFFLRIEQLCREEVPNMDSSNPFQKIFDNKIRNEEIYNSRMLDIFTHYAEKFL